METRETGCDTPFALRYHSAAAWTNAPGNATNVGHDLFNSSSPRGPGSLLSPELATLKLTSDPEGDIR